MRKCKCFLSVVLSIIIGFAFSPSTSIAKTMDISYEPGSIAGSNKNDGNIGDIGNVDSAAVNKTDEAADGTADESVNNAGTNNEKVLIPPRYNCDPKMLIPGNPNIDPKFLIEKLP